MEDLKKYLEEQGIEYHANASIKPYLTMGIGGDVRLVVVVDRAPCLKEVLIRLCKSKDRSPFVLLGSGSNVIFPDDFSRLIAVINRTAEVSREGAHILKVNSGISIADMMVWNIRHNIGGMDFLAGIPGSVGGAAAVNAGAFGRSISDILEKAEIVTPQGDIKIVDNDYFRFTYRNSLFKYGSEVILNVFLQYTDVESDRVRQEVEARIKYRQENHPCSTHHSAGCFFKNPVINGKKTSAGQLIEGSGFKGAVFKGVRVSEEHANFIINNNNATFADLKAVETVILRKVLQEKGVQLEREVIYISPDGEKY